MWKGQVQCYLRPSCTMNDGLPRPKNGVQSRSHLHIQQHPLLLSWEGGLDPSLCEYRSIDHLKFFFQRHSCTQWSFCLAYKYITFSRTTLGPVLMMSSGRTICIDFSCFTYSLYSYITSSHFLTQWIQMKFYIMSLVPTKTTIGLCGHGTTGCCSCNHRKIVAAVTTADQYCAPMVHDWLILGHARYMLLIGDRVLDDEWHVIVETGMTFVCQRPLTCLW
jgi:hypothetical protein